MLTRRAVVMTGIASVGLVSGVPSVQSAPITESPLFSVNDGMAFMLSAKPCPEDGPFLFSRITLMMIKAHHNDGVPVRSVIDAENQILASAKDWRTSERVWPSNGKIIRHTYKYDDHHGDLLADIRDGLRLVSDVSMRYPANYILMHSATYPRLITPRSTLILKQPIRCGRWWKVGVFDGATILVNDIALPPNDVVTFYRGTHDSIVDGPAGVIRRDDGALSLINGDTEQCKIHRFTV